MPVVFVAVEIVAVVVVDTVPWASVPVDKIQCLVQLLRGESGGNGGGDPVRLLLLTPDRGGGSGWGSGILQRSVPVKGRLQ